MEVINKPREYGIIRKVTTTDLLGFILFVSLIVLLNGCATIVKGSTQPLAIVTKPAGATCTLRRKGKVIAIVSPTPGEVVVSKSKQDITYECEKKGYKKAIGVIKSDFQGWTMGNVLIGGIIGAGIDAASGAMNEYDSSAVIVLSKE